MGGSQSLSLSVRGIPMAVGASVRVRNRYLGAWSRGFQVAEQVPGGYRIRRLSDGSVFPEVFSPDDVRP